MRRLLRFHRISIAMTRGMTVFQSTQSTHSMRSATICPEWCDCQKWPEVIRSQHERRCRKTGKSLFSLLPDWTKFLFCSILHIVSKPLLPEGIGGTMVADKREQVKIEQNNCYCSIRAVNVVYGAGATKLPVAWWWQRTTKPACVTTVHTRWFFLPRRSLTGAPLFRSPLPCSTQDSKSTGQTVGAFTVFQCERVLPCMTELC